ncbi:hypothetical protein BN946_scf185033.g14 [Trametes cinnabarina]|uniref:Uncharacterized protein n=1 Tax=Pycnoporus cinnabarinus TaxID=5643 RepID=A0A060SQN0_PYCCI|nr:hypothetical protein BN946_scf185033.g14 [Trametes cinnabarina]
MDSDDSTSTSLACIPPLEPQLQGGGELAGDVVMMNPPPSPPPPVAGTKREMVGVKAFALDNVKAARVNDTANVRPLSRNMDKSQFATAPKSRRTVPLHNGGMSSTSQIAQPPAQAAFQFGVPQAAPQQFAPPGHATLTSHVLQPQYIQGHNLVPLVNQGPYGQMPAIINGFVSPIIHSLPPVLCN